MSSRDSPGQRALAGVFAVYVVALPAAIAAVWIRGTVLSTGGYVLNGSNTAVVTTGDEVVLNLAPLITTVPKDISSQLQKGAAGLPVIISSPVAGFRWSGATGCVTVPTRRRPSGSGVLAGQLPAAAYALTWADELDS